MQPELSNALPAIASVGLLFPLSLCFLAGRQYGLRPAVFAPLAVPCLLALYVRGFVWPVLRVLEVGDANGCSELFDRVAAHASIAFPLMFGLEALYFAWILRARLRDTPRAVPMRAPSFLTNPSAAARRGD